VLFDAHSFFVPEDLCWKRLEELWWEEMRQILNN
jgi:hypothetical protein